MIKIYNEVHHKGHAEGQEVDTLVKDFFAEHEYLDFTNALVWVKEVNPENSRGQAMYECSIEARLPNQDPVFAGKKGAIIINALRDALETVKEEILKKKAKMRSISRSREARP